MAVRRALACVLLLAAGCGGDAFSAGGGGSPSEGGTNSRGGDDAGGSSTTGGTSRGGAASAGAGGTTSAGSNAGGTDSGGMSMGGTENGGSDTSGGMSGGMSGGNATSCNVDMDCTSCAYPTAPANEGDCYCVGCADTPMSLKACANNQQHWEKFCANQAMPCPAVKCLPSVPPSCEKGRCVDAL